MSANYTQLPPSYGAASQPQARTEGTGDDIPDDLKYGVSVWQSDRSIRHAFMRKVYAILTLQLLATAVVGGVMRHADATNGFLLRHVWTVYAAMFGSIGALLGVMWKRDSHPTNAVLLGLFTVLEAYTLGAVTAFYPTGTVVQALAITLGLFVVLTLFTMQSRYDFSRMGPILFFALSAVVLVGLVQLFIPFNRVFDMAMAVIMAVVFCGYILFDTYMIMNRMSPDDYIFASISLYLDVVNLFLAILRFLGDQE
ncbi:hypothetical protein LPJ63_001882 [Coemansia sp. RSA 2711]|nr:hypothetical protein LPJ63_001882 [Coemansia sp. RSA 2711]KAJ1842577.1 hypothetical protein LPJ70_003757 [Coemansia sp. RSA 2708]KAJ2313206.1 hypothetical protein IWW54_001650 [Coemansia sp. RSA 2705]KAJ2320891.1 hypothetical protein IWW52_001081 [Coemansia sp. RSA 2704]KAJ2368782.1 hypothetical protein H4S01_001390 [Coemansia sp. RSA 2610]KAJ2392148.1 hypothetical protein H4S02_000942 [Coemansia sp. RSA 2611]